MDTIRILVAALAVMVGGIFFGLGMGHLGSSLQPRHHAPPRELSQERARPTSNLVFGARPKPKGNAEAGMKVFANNCAACHQQDGTGQPGLAPSVRNRDFLAVASDRFIRKTIVKGRPGTAMVARPDLDGQPTADIIAYLRALEVVNPVDVQVDARRKHLGDAAAGAVKYTQYCASCHGAHGEGYSAGGAGPGIGLPGFLAVASDDYIFQTVKHGRAGTAMRSLMGPEGLANLSETDVADIITHLRAAAPKPGAKPSSAPLVAGRADKGKLLFAANCAVCHQKDGAGRPGLAPSIRNRDFLALSSDEFIERTIEGGRKGTAMVPRPDLAGQKTADIIAFLRAAPTENVVSVEVDPHLRIRGDASVGAAKFSQYCASCHGAKGEGYSAGGAGPGIGLSGFLNVASDDYIYQTVKVGRVGTAMRAFMGAEGLANLDHADVADVISYLRALETRTN